MKKRVCRSQMARETLWDALNNTKLKKSQGCFGLPRLNIRAVQQG